MTRYKAKTSSHALDHHTVICLSTFLTLSALHSYKWYKLKMKWSEWKIENLQRKRLCWDKPADHALTSLLRKIQFVDDTQLSDRTISHTYLAFLSTLSLHYHLFFFFFFSSFIFILYLTIHSSSGLSSRETSADRPTRDEFRSSCLTGGGKNTDHWSGRLNELLFYIDTLFYSIFWTTPTSLSSWTNTPCTSVGSE